jgi:GMP synthase (glutamine-hydrolysing)
MTTAKIARFMNLTDAQRGEPKRFVEGALNFIRDNVDKNEKVEIMVSGGVDSSVTAALFHIELGDRLYTTHVDTGFMRLIKGVEEPEIISKEFSDFQNFKLINARELFYGKVMGIDDAEKKRLGFRESYEKVTDEQMVQSVCNVMTQGTIRPDIIETDGGVKSQHNVHLKFSKVEKIVEPLAGLFKNDVRKIAEFLYSEYKIQSLEHSYIRQPFPGPGLSVRTVGMITPEKLTIEKKANDILEQSIDEYIMSLHGTTMYINEQTGEQIPFQSFAATFDDRFSTVDGSVIDRLKNKTKEKIDCRVLDVKATGVREGKRVYSPILCLEMKDPNFNILEKIGREIPVETPFSRVLSKVDSKHGSLDYVVAIRSVNSIDALSAAINPIPKELIEKIANDIVSKCNVKEVYWDISSKPPATIEYE